MSKTINLSMNLSIGDCFKIFETGGLLKGLSKQTLLWYDETIEFFSKYYDKNYPVVSVDDNVIQGYILECLKRGNKKSTINTRLIALKSFFNWCYKEEYILKPITVNLLKDIQEVKETYTKDELDKLLKKPDLKKCQFTEYRDWVICNFLISTACRVGTLINIKIEDIDLEAQEVIYRHTKTGKQQIIPLTAYMVGILKEYLIYRKGNINDYLFCSRYSQPLNSNSLRISLNKYNRRRGVERTGRHIYRNTFAKLWILNGGDAFRLQKMLGHSTIDMTKRYIEMYSNDLKIDFELYNPINNIISKQNNYITMKKK